MKYKCVDCGLIFDGSLLSCPQCGCPRSACREYVTPGYQTPPPPPAPPFQQPQAAPSPAPAAKTHRDWANFIYECGVLYWETFSSRYAQFTGRASRTEFWSFYIISLLFGLTTGIGTLIVLLPMIGVSIRRMHDINKCGWWSICPIACIFLFLKKSDAGYNKYGAPQSYAHIFS